MVLLIGSIELTGSIWHNNKKTFSTQNEALGMKFNIFFKTDMYPLLGVSCGPSFPEISKKGPFVAQIWPSYGPCNWFFLSLSQYAQGYIMPKFRFLASIRTDIFNFMTQSVSNSVSQ